ncbi:MAG: glycosyltransferase [Planctomycetota bacterium]|nr:glycosyltransferase [Planctomycetota bacterium]
MARTVVRIITRLNRGGPLRQLCALVPELQKLGWEGPVVTGRVARHEPDGAADLEAAGARVIRVRALGRGLDPSADPRAMKAIAAIVRRFRPDIVHTHTAKAGAFGRAAAHLVGTPAVHTFHGHHFDASLMRAFAARQAERFLGRYTAAAIALTPRQRRDIVEVHRILPAAKVHVVGPGLDIGAFRARAEAGTHGLPSFEGPRFLWTGRFVPVKAPHLLVEAVAASRVPFHLTMLGRGPLRDGVRARIAKLGLAGRIACPGDAVDVAPWVAAADGLVLCSRSEGAPLSLIEAMALGTPVVATTVGGVPDIVAHEGEGLWVAPGDVQGLARALDRLAGDPVLGRAMGMRGYEGAEVRFGGARLARETAAVYEGVIGRL